jgi:hypothetical protein
MGLSLAIGAGVGLAGTASAQAPKNDPANAEQAFEKLKSLVGHWEAKTDKGTASASYQLISGGTVVLERVEMGGDHEMITAYYLDGHRLLMTHYCATGNQPRMKVGSFDPKTNQIDFQFLDATNLPDPNAGHMHNAVFTFRGPNEVTEDWTFYKDGKAGFTVPLDYHRVD